MVPPITTARLSADPFQELLTPVKDPAQSFAVNISELLQSYVRSFVKGSGEGNFNMAGLMIQGSSSIYGKKVEYLHNLATKLYASLVKHKKEDGTKKDSKEREKHSKESKFNDPFFSTDIKLGKNLSCLRKKFVAKIAASKKASKKSEKKFTYIPIELLPLDQDEKGSDFYDTSGNKVGLKGEFTLNTCKVTSSGWLLMPIVSHDMVSSQLSSPDYTLDEKRFDADVHHDTDSDMPDSSPLDEGYPPSSGYSETPPTSVPSSQGTDDGLGSWSCTPQEPESQPVSDSGTPTEGPSQSESGDNTPSADVFPADTPMEGIHEGSNDISPGVEGNENIPLEDADIGPRPHRSMRQALKLCQIPGDETAQQPEENASTQLSTEEVAVVKRAIQKKNTCNLPSKLKSDGETKLKPTSEFCARTFFSMDRKFSKNNYISVGVLAFAKNPALLKRFRHIQATLLAHNKIKDKKRKASAEAAENDEDDGEIDPGLMDDGEIELDLIDPVTNDDVISTPLEAGDIVIENNPMLPAPILNNENPLAEEEPMLTDDLDRGLTAHDNDDIDSSFVNAARLQCDLFREDLQQYVQTSDVSKKVQEWETVLKPFLEKLKKREEFDINLFGSHILSAFKENNRKQSMKFRNFCKGKEKYQIHRYFMALLPLVNIRNVDIQPEKRDDGGDDIEVTLLSRRMHHRELEEFGHTGGEHS